MAIEKKGKNSHLGNLSVENLSTLETIEPNQELPSKETPASEKPNMQQVQHPKAQHPDSVKKKKSIDNWGRPRKELIPGVKEVSVTIQLPKTVLANLRKKGKKEGKSLKELVGTAIINQYPECV